VPKLSAQEATAKWAERASAASGAYTAGIARVTISPGVLAAEKEQKWLQAVTASASKWAARLRNLDLAQWKKITTELGGQRYGQGVQQKQGKYQAFAEEFFPYLAQGQEAIARMPDTTFEQRTQRAMAMMRHSHEFKRA
jgi:hypothetical protein